MKYTPELPDNVIKEVNDKGLNYNDDQFDNFVKIFPNENNSVIRYEYRDKNHEDKVQELDYRIKLNIDYENKKISVVVGSNLSKEDLNLDFTYDFMIDPLEEPKELVLFSVNYFRLKNKI